jgi:beta-fructofuranosidase
LANTPTVTPTSGPDLEGSSETWRDPVVLPDPDGDGWHLFVTARSVEAGRNDDGVIAHAASQDLTTWTLGPPLCAPGAGFGQLEVLQNVVVAGRPVLAFTCHPQEQTAERIAEWGEYCTWSVPSPGVLGPWDMSTARPFLPEPDLFAAPIVRLRDGGSAIIGFRNLEPKGDPQNLGFEIIDPIPVTLDAEGYLVAR